MGLLILIGSKIGGWMMIVYFTIKLIVWYTPHVLNTPKLPFVNRDFLQVYLLFKLDAKNFCPAWGRNRVCTSTEVIKSD